MSKKKTKYLIETSALPVALGQSTPDHCDYFDREVGDGVLYTSIYIRKEFIHRWILEYVRMAYTVDHVSDLSSALLHLNQDFSSRKVKTQNHAMAILLKQKGRIDNSRTAAKKIGRLAVGELRRFDRRFRSRIQNRGGCRIGGKELKVDYNHFFSDLRDFVKSQDVVDDCPINEFLGLEKHGHAPRLLEIPGVDETKSGKYLAKLCSDRKWVTCIQCRRIGDAVIAMEQPRTFCLIHLDNDFKVLCEATQRPNKPILSERGFEKGVPRVD